MVWLFPAGTIIDGAGYALSANNVLPFNDELIKSGVDANVPKAYLNWAVFNRDYIQNLDKSGFAQITTDAREDGSDVDHKLLKPLNEIIIDEPGLVYIWLSNENENPVEVYFDNFKVTHTKSPIIQQEEYYPFGLAFNSYARENSTPNKCKYGGKEEQTDLALNTIDWGWRQYDPAISRWNVVDQWAEKYHTTFPYAFVSNNPILNREIDGRYFDEKNEKKAAKIERKAEKRADKLEAKAAKIEARGEDSRDQRALAGELRQSGQDIKNMRNDASTEYKYAKLGGSESKY